MCDMYGDVLVSIMLILCMSFYFAILILTTTACSQDDKSVYLGNLNTLQHCIGGKLYALDQDTLLYSDNSQDGDATGIVVRYRLADTQHHITATKYVCERQQSGKCGQWKLMAPTAYMSKKGTWDVVVLLKDASGQLQKVQKLDRFDVYCALASSEMAVFTNKAKFMGVANIQRGELANKISKLEKEVGSQCQTYIDWSCHQLSPQMNLHWKLDAQRNGLIKCRLEGNIMEDEYMAVGISCSADTFQMTGGDVVVVYQFQDRFYARDYFISKRGQCGVSGEGTCPDTNHPGATDDITSIEDHGFCEYTEPQLDSYLSHTTYQLYRSSLNYSCDDDDDQPWAEFNWTVPRRDESDDSEVFYQCSIHQHLSWRFVIVDPGTDSGVCGIIKSVNQATTTTATTPGSDINISKPHTQQSSVIASLTTIFICILIR